MYIGHCTLAVDSLRTVRRDCSRRTPLSSMAVPTSPPIWPGELSLYTLSCPAQTTPHEQTRRHVADGRGRSHSVTPVRSLSGRSERRRHHLRATQPGQLDRLTARPSVRRGRRRRQSRSGSRRAAQVAHRDEAATAATLRRPAGSGRSRRTPHSRRGPLRRQSQDRCSRGQHTAAAFKRRHCLAGVSGTSHLKQPGSRAALPEPLR